jgi:hypothetical protein
MEGVESGESEKVRESEQPKIKWDLPRGLATPCTRPLGHRILPSGQWRQQCRPPEPSNDDGRSEKVNANVTTLMEKKKKKRKTSLASEG